MSRDIDEWYYNSRTFPEARKRSSVSYAHCSCSVTVRSRAKTSIQTDLNVFWRRQCECIKRSVIRWLASSR